jgi:hypothetical protein
MGQDNVQGLGARLRREKHEYTHGEHRPLGSFLLLMGVHGTGLALGSAAVRRSGRTLPESPRWSDLALITVATHKLSRLLAKAPVTSPIRAPFTTFAGTSGEAELAEEVRGTGPRKALGELLTCPFCLGQWVASGFVFGLLLAPKPTRWTAALFTAETGSDLLQFLYAKVQQSAT